MAAPREDAWKSSMKRKTLLWMVALTVFVGNALHAQDRDISGNWQGVLQPGNGMRVVVKVAKDNGKLKAVMYSIDLGGPPIPVTSIALQGTSVNYAIRLLDLTYTGILNSAGDTISGNQTQRGRTFVLNLTRVSEENTWAIPEPLKPMAPDANPGFEVATIKPSEPERPGKSILLKGRHLLIGNYDVNDLILFAFGLHSKQIVGAPDWFSSALYDIDGVADVEGQPSLKQEKIMVQKLLTDRFKLVSHHDMKELSVYAITVEKGGSKLAGTAPDQNSPPGFRMKGFGKLTVVNKTMADFAFWMTSIVMDRPVIDRTGLTDRFNFTLDWTPDDSQFTAFQLPGATIPHPTDEPNAPPGLYTAIREQLGLKLESVKAPVDVIVIDQVKRPSEN